MTAPRVSLTLWLFSLLGAWSGGSSLLAGDPALADCNGDPLPPGAVARMGSIRLRHNRWVHAVAYSPDGKTLASLGEDNCLRLWDADGKPLRQFQRDAAAKRLAFAPDGKSLVIDEAGGWFVLLDADTGKERLRVKASTVEVRALVFSPDGKVLATGGRDGLVRLWNAETGEALASLSGHTKAVNSLSFSADGKRLASASRDRTVRVWDMATAKELLSIKAFPPRPGPHPEEQSVSSVAFSPDGKTLAAGASGWNPGDGTVRLYDAETGDVARELSGFEKERCVSSVAFTADGKMLATAGGDTSMRLWDAKTGKVLHDLRRGNIETLCFSPDDRTLATGDLGGRVRLWDVVAGGEKPASEGHERDVESVAFTPNGRTLATRASDQTVRLWDARTGRAVRAWPAPSKPAFAGCPTLAFLADGGKVIGEGADGDLVFWEAATGRELHRLRPGGAGVEAIAVSADEKVLALEIREEGRGPLVKLWDVSGEKELKTLEIPLDVSEALLARGKVTFAPDGKTLAAIEGDSVYLLDASTGLVKRQLKHPLHAVAAVAFSPDGKVVASCETETLVDGTRTVEWVLSKHIHLWDATTGAELLAIDGREGDFTALVFSPDGLTLAASNRGRSIRLWETTTGKELLRWTPDGGNTAALAFAPDGRTLASAHANGTALVWDLRPAGTDRPKAGIDDKERERLWSVLAGDDAAAAYRAGWDLSMDAVETVSFLRMRMSAVPAESAQNLRALIADLDHDDFDRREAASAELARLGEQAIPSLRQALTAPPSEEVRIRASALLVRLEKKTVQDPDMLRSLRAAGVLERIGGGEARALLKALGVGAPDARLTRQARAALDRLAKRPGP